MYEELRRFIRDRFGITTLVEMPRRHLYQILSFSCHGSRAIEYWRTLQAATDEFGYWPLIIGGDKEADRLLAIEEEPPRKILDIASTLNADQWLANKRQELREDAPDFERSLHGEWPVDPRPMTNFTIPFERVGDGPAKDKVTIALFPTKYGWEVPAYLNFGGWNECPDSAVQVIMMKRWFDEFGAELVGMKGDIVEMYASRPPRTRENALKLAEEQYLYCEDIVLQGTETLEVLAAGLLGNNIWFFWWD